jgi:tetratricopeptide (TPR) repeat protein
VNTGPIFTDYGDGGDLAGSRRARKAYRFIVISILLLTASVWIAETYLRYDPAERAFVDALRLDPENAVISLRSAVKIDREIRDTPTAKYYQALAVREEFDRMLEAYREAYDADPKNPMFAVLYGAALFESGRSGEAVEIFRIAAALPMKNALPGYLEAAAEAHRVRDEGGPAFENAMVILARSNNNREPILFSRPLWHTRYPNSGVQYAELQRSIERAMVRPLRYLSSRIGEEVKKRIEAGEGALVRSWIDQGFHMGERLLEESEPSGTITAIAGLSIQLEMLELRQALRQHLGESVSESTIEHMVKLRQAIQTLEEFEQERDSRIEEKRQDYLIPIESVLGGGILLFSVYLVTFVAHKLLHLKKTAWSVAHNPSGRWVLGAGTLAMVLMLGLMVALQRLPSPQTEYESFMQGAWWSVLAVLLLFGLVYPSLTIPSPEEVTRRAGRLEEMEDLLRIARHTYIRVYFSLIFRYYGILSGVYVAIGCGWIIGYRILLGLYPWQLNLLVSGMLDRESILVQSAIQLARIEGGA